MKKQWILFVLALAMVLTLSACGCKHEVWNDATCLTPKTCAECGETEGEALGHVWLAATCETAKTCEACGATDGAPKGHAWADATCEAPKTCSDCKLTEGEALGHTWEEATTEKPMTCTACDLTEGDRIITDPRFTTASTKELQGTWSMTVQADGNMLEVPELEGTIELQLLMEFGNDGTMKAHVKIPDEQVFMDAMTEYTLKNTYAEMEALGYSEEECDALIESQFGCSTEEYVQTILKEMDFNAILSDAGVEGVYYVEDGQLYTADFWEQTAVPTEYSVDGDQLTIYEDMWETGETVTVLTRVPEESL